MAESAKMIKKVEHLQVEIETAFSELIHARWAGTDSAWRPAIDFFENDKAFFIEADLPGINPDDVQLKAEELTVTICGKRKNMVSINKGVSIISERATGKFCRTIHLHCAIDVNNAQAQFKDGVYEIYLPKKVSSCSTNN
ncbi:MAG TPA: Hsp20/alpha crystallin family protein [Chitinispirillaceae bacterium]|nr:Hsp20/alpha crystallin family protein [Chitinispirillaceae bacterium]